MEVQRLFAISTAIPYPNGKPHMGHAMEFIQADFLARYYRAQGTSVFFQTGLDVHGQKIYRTAEREGVPVEAFITRQKPLFDDILQQLQIEPDRFISTEDTDHIAMSQALWQRCLEAGDIYKKMYRAWYNVKEEEFLGSADDVKDPSIFNVDKEFIELIEEENYFFRLSKYTDKVIELIEKGEYTVTPANRAQEILNFAKKGLQDVSISREKAKLPWGVPAPNDDSQVMYVWFDALTNYLTGTATLEDGQIKPNQFWPFNLHCVGKDIARFHALMWPAMLLSAGLATPKELMVHGFILSGGRKMSKSWGNVVDPLEMVATHGSDALRWYLLAQVPTLDDGDFTKERFDAVYASDLANDYGNLVSRVVAMSRKYCNGAVPRVSEEQVQNLEKVLVEEAWETYHQAVAALNLEKALATAHELVVFANRRIEEQKPWVLAKDEGQKAALAEHLYEQLEIIRHITAMVAPAIPTAASKVQQIIFGDIPDVASGKWGVLQPGATLPEENLILFPRIDHA